jgi:RNA polymerase sigma-70 factor (ECF subfamily)
MWIFCSQGNSKTPFSSETKFNYYIHGIKQSEFHIIQTKLRAGDETPLYELYRLYRDEFIKWSSNTYGGSQEQSKDAFQEAILDFHQNVIHGKLTELSSSLKTYLFQIGKHKLLNILKKDRRMTYNDALHLITHGEVDTFMEEENKAYTQEQISNAIEQLPVDCQKVLNLFYFKEYDMESIARELNYKNSDTAKSKKSVCMKNLMIELKKLSMLFTL